MLRATGLWDGSRDDNYVAESFTFFTTGSKNLIALFSVFIVF